MVSLAENKSRSFSVDEEETVRNEGNMSEGQILTQTDRDELLSNMESKLIFKPVDTLAVCFFMIVLAIGKLIVSVVISIRCSEDECSIKPLSLLLYLHGLSWAIFLICDQYIQYQHMRVRHRGYLEFYLQLRDWSQFPFRIVSAWSTLLLVVSIVLHDHCASDDSCGKSFQLTKAEYITVCIGAEVVVLMIILAYYAYRIRIFNSSKAPPDVLREDLMSSTSEIGPGSVGCVDEEIFERQADMIRYYKDHNAMLQRKVLELNYQLSGRTPNMC